MKSIRQWLEELPEPIRSQALANLENPQWPVGSSRAREHNPDRMVPSLYLAICTGFRWSTTDQPHQWPMIASHLEEASEDKKRTMWPLL